MPQIVTIDVSTTATETPSNLQQMGAIVCYGATTLATNTYSPISQMSDFTAIASSGSAETGEILTNFFAQGDGTVYVLELGTSNSNPITEGLAPFIVSNPKLFYCYLIPYSLSANHTTDLVTLANAYVSDTSQVYFLFDDTEAHAVSFAGIKSVIASVPSASASTSTESISAGILYNILTATPSTAKKLAPFAFRYMYGYTAWPEIGNSTNFTRLRTENINIIGSGSSAGVSDTLLFWGYTMDGKPISYWYAVDWAAINIARDLAYEIVIGSNSTTSPLVYDQRGITRLQARATQTLTTATAYGVIIGQSTVSAVDFATYVSENTGDFASGTYNGLSATITPMRGFEQITFYLTVDFSGTAVVEATTSTSS